MKKNFLFLSLTMLAMFVVTSCSDSPMNKILEQVPENVDIVVVGDLKTVIESAGGSIEDGKFKLPSFVRDEMNSSAMNDFDDVNSALKNSGIDPDVCGIFLNYKDDYPVFVFYLKDKKKFISFLEDLKYKERSDEDGFQLYKRLSREYNYEGYDDYDYMAIAGDYAYWVEDVWERSEFKPEKALPRYIRDAKESPYSKTSFADYITSGNAAGASIRLPRELRQKLREEGMPSSVVSMYEGVVCMKGNIVNDEATVDVKLFSEDGKAKSMKDFDESFNFKARINKDALKYLGKDETFVMAMSIKDIKWDKYFDAVADASDLSSEDKIVMDQVKKYLKSIDGTIAMGFGFTNGLESFVNLNYGNNAMNQFDATLVVETKESAAKGVMTDLKTLMEQHGIPFEESSKGFTLEFPGEKGTIYAQTDGNYIVMSNHRIRKGNDNLAVESVKFEDYIFAASIAFSKDNALMRDLGIDNDILLTIGSDPENMELTAMLEIKGGNSEGIVAKVARIIVDVMKDEKKIDATWDEARRRRYGDYSYDDTMYVEPYDEYDYADTAAVWEEVVVEEAR